MIFIKHFDFFTYYHLYYLKKINPLLLLSIIASSYALWIIVLCNNMLVLLLQNVNFCSIYKLNVEFQKGKFWFLAEFQPKLL